MTTPNDPPRILSQPSGFLHDAVAAAKGEVPSPEKLLLLQGKIAAAAAAGLGAGATSSAGAGAGATSLATTAKSVLWVKIAGAVVAGSVAVSGAAYLAQPNASPAPSILMQTAPVAPSAVVPPAGLATEEASAVPVASLPLASASSNYVQAAPTSTKSHSADLTEETRLLSGAQQALAANPAEALRIAETHRKAFPTGVLSQERDALVVEALVKQGRMVEAKRAAAAFARNYPGSSHQRRIQDLVGDN